MWWKRYKELTELTNKLKSMLDNPQPGLESWRNAVDSVVSEIRQWHCPDSWPTGLYADLTRHDPTMQSKDKGCVHCGRRSSPT